MNAICTFRLQRPLLSVTILQFWVVRNLADDADMLAGESLEVEVIIYWMDEAYSGTNVQFYLNMDYN